MKFLLDVIRSEINIVGRKFDEFASGSLAYQYADLIAQDDYLGAMLKKHKDDLCVLRSDARAMDFFESGYDRNLKTLFIWEGTTQYLKAEAVDETLAFISNNSGEGSSIIFDYAFQSALNGTLHREEAKKWRTAFERRGEPPTFGIEEEDIEEFLSSRGFYQVKNVTTESLEGSYFSGANQGRRVTRLGGIVHATVKPQEQT